MKRCLNCNATFNASDWLCPICSFRPVEMSGVTCFAPDQAIHSEYYDASSYSRISKFQNTHFWFRGRNELICSQLKKYFSDALSLIEIGCGTGQVLRAIHHAMPEMKISGTEIYTSGLAYASQVLPDAEYLQLDAQSMPYVDEFDVVCAFDVIEHIDDDLRVLQQMYQVCKLGGGIILTVPQHRWLWSYKDEVAHHKRRYERLELEQKVRNSGFEVIAITSFISLLLPLMYFSRKRQQSAKSTDLQSEYNISPIINSFCLMCSRIENFFIKHGINIRWGGSLLLVAKKLSDNHIRMNNS